jgi:hypothetical protein
VIHFLEMHQDRDAEFAGESIHAAQLGTIGRHMEFQFAETAGPLFHGLRESCLGRRVRDVVAGKPREAAW